MVAIESAASPSSHEMSRTETFRRGAGYPLGVVRPRDINRVSHDRETQLSPRWAHSTLRVPGAPTWPLQIRLALPRRLRQQRAGCSPLVTITRCRSPRLDLVGDGVDAADRRA